MNEQQRAVVQQALEAAYLAGFQATGEGYNAEYPFEGCNPEANVAWVRDRDNALRQLLEQPEPVQEPVGEVSGHDWSTGLLYRDLEPGTPLYTTPPTQPADWVGLTDEERQEIWKGCDPQHAGYVTALVEVKLREKNGGNV
jgi:hypothetical protein